MEIAKVLGEALGERFDQPIKLADVAGVIVQRHDHDDPVVCFYAPPLREDERAVISVSRRVSGKDRDAMLAIGLGHHFNRHRTKQLYMYEDGGATFDAPEEAAQAKEFARGFLRFSRGERLTSRATG